MNEIRVTFLREWVKSEVRRVIRADRAMPYFSVIENFIAFMNGVTDGEFMSELEYNKIITEAVDDDRKKGKVK